MIRLILPALFFMVVAGLNAQTISVDFAFYPDSDISLCLKRAMVCDTVFRGRLDDKGRTQIAIPDAYSDYRGMASITAGQGQLDFIVSPGENPVIRCAEEYPYGGNTLFSSSPENEALQGWFVPQVKRQQKIMLLTGLEDIYDREDAFLSLLAKEKALQEAGQQSFEGELEASPLYAARFIRLYNFLSRDVQALVMADSVQMQTVRKYVQNNLDIEALYTSGLWYNVLNGLLALYDKGTPYHMDFIGDMSLLLKRTKQDKIYTTLSENLFAICESMGWNDLEEHLTNFLTNDGRIKEPTGKLKLLMNLYKLNVGSKAPALSQGVLPEGNVLLVFHETGCGNCTTELQQLKDNYPLLKEKGYEVVSVAADMNRETFDNISASFPWKQKYCDLQGISGTDFRNFGILGTPTIYLIGQNGIVQGRYARLQDTKIIKN
ncbi:peroxiredoxin [Dysgonomonas sp. 521]|uniref:peroxiredoxin family protein n=1 Tax=Dysgonomonas sp. 521 TaxID=2302932 RepID=UPI0013D57CFB|nr:thioredoxin family protein [Dysgonomonas sp. 521]